MSGNRKPLAIAAAITVLAFAGAVLYRTRQVINQADEQVRIDQVVSDASVIDRVDQVLPSFTAKDRDGEPFNSDQLSESIWIGFSADRSEGHVTDTFNDLPDQFEDSSLDRPIQYVSVTDDSSNSRSDNENRLALDADFGVQFAGGDSRNSLTDPNQCILVDPFMRIRGSYDLTDRVDQARLKNDVLIVSSEITPLPASLFETDWLEERAAQQLAQADQVSVRHDFSFRDIQPQSGIEFVNKVVDQSSRDYEAAHYDHGTGVAVADVDSDNLYDIYFVKQVGLSQLYKNKGDGTFIDITKEAGLDFSARISVTASFADIDNDSDQDLFVTSVRGGNLLFENDGRGKFTDITEFSGLQYSGHSSSAVFFDFDNDGKLDLFLTNVGKYTTDEKRKVTSEFVHRDPPIEHEFYTVVDDAFGGHLLQDERGEESILYRNLGDNTFQDVSDQMNMADDSWTGDAIPVDFNADGWQDLYLLNMQGADQYYVNLDGKKFENRTDQAFPVTPWGSMGIQSFDFENDGDLDLMITDMHSDMSQQVDWTREKEKADLQWPESFTQTEGKSVWGNAFYRNDSDEVFKEVSDQVNAENYWPWGLSSGDLNADGFEDVFVTSSMNQPFRYAVNSLLLNGNGKRFFDCEFILGVEPRRDGRLAAPMFEVTSTQEPNHIALDGRIGRAAVWSALGSRSSVIFDFDEDGDLDIITNEFSSEPMVLQSNLSDAESTLNFLKVKLVGKQSNRDGLGAKVVVTTKDMTLTKIHDGQSGYMSQSVFPLYFGLGKEGSISNVTINWPSGEVQSITEVQPNQTLVVKESITQSE